MVKFFCMRCKAPKEVDINEDDDVTTGNGGRRMARKACPDCGANMCVTLKKN